MPEVKSNASQFGSQPVLLNAGSAFPSKMAYPPDMLTMTIARTPSPKECTGKLAMYLACVYCSIDHLIIYKAHQRYFHIDKFHYRN